MNLLQNNQPVINMEDGKLLANLNHCYDENSSFFLAQQFLQQQNDLPPKMRYKLASVTKFCTLFHEQSQLFFEKKSSFYEFMFERSFYFTS